MDKRVLALAAILILIAGMATVSEYDSGFTKTKDVKVCDMHFKIPKAFKENKDLRINGEYLNLGGVGFTTWSKSFDNKQGDFISIAVSSIDGVKITNDVVKLIGSGKKKITGVKGYEYDTEPFQGFAYAKDGKLITITATHESVLGTVVAK